MSWGATLGARAHTRVTGPRCPCALLRFRVLSLHFAVTIRTVTCPVTPRQIVAVYTLMSVRHGGTLLATSDENPEVKFGQTPTVA